MDNYFALIKSGFSTVKAYLHLILKISKGRNTINY